MRRIPFSSDSIIYKILIGKKMSTICKTNNNNTYIVYVKGASEAIIEKCS